MLRACWVTLNNFGAKRFCTWSGLNVESQDYFFVKWCCTNPFDFSYVLVWAWDLKLKSGSSHTVLKLNFNNVSTVKRDFRHAHLQNGAIQNTGTLGCSKEVKSCSAQTETQKFSLNRPVFLVSSCVGERRTKVRLLFCWSHFSHLPNLLCIHLFWWSHFQDGKSEQNSLAESTYFYFVITARSQRNSLLLFGSSTAHKVSLRDTQRKLIPYYSGHNVVIEFPNYVVFLLSPLTNS